MSVRPPRCRGLWGFLFGHKFNNANWEWSASRYFDKCQRCGYKP